MWPNWAVDTIDWSLKFLCFWYIAVTQMRRPRDLFWHKFHRTSGYKYVKNNNKKSNVLSFHATATSIRMLLTCTRFWWHIVKVCCSVLGKNMKIKKNIPGIKCFHVFTFEHMRNKIYFDTPIYWQLKYGMMFHVFFLSYKNWISIFRQYGRSQNKKVKNLLNLWKTKTF